MPASVGTAGVDTKTLAFWELGLGGLLKGVDKVVDSNKVLLRSYPLTYKAVTTMNNLAITS